MKKQNFIAIVENKNFQMITFERFSCAKVETVKKQMQELFKNSLYRACTPGAVSVSIYRTPDGYKKENYPCCCFNIKKEV